VPELDIDESLLVAFDLEAVVCWLQVVQHVGCLMHDDIAIGIVTLPARPTDVRILAGGRALPTKFHVSDIYAVIGKRETGPLARCQGTRWRVRL
jgi:hypothetical protein